MENIETIQDHFMFFQTPFLKSAKVRVLPQNEFTGPLYEKNCIQRLKKKYEKGFKRRKSPENVFLGQKERIEYKWTTKVGFPLNRDEDLFLSHSS